MAAKNLTMTGDFHVSPREIDFVTRFERNWEHLRAILGVMRPIKKSPGTVLKSYSASVALQLGAVGEGEVIPYSKATVTEKPYVELAFSKFAKGVSFESIDKFGKVRAVDMTDTEFLNEIQESVTSRFYAFLKTGTLREHVDTFQAALANAQAAVLDKWRSMHRTSTGIVGFANLRDAYRWLGEATIGSQVIPDNGLNYLKAYMGLSPLFLLSNNELPPGAVIATPRENIVLYYADPSASDFSDAGFEFTTGRGQTNLIGVHSKPNYETMVADLHAVMAMEMFAEYQDGIAIVEFGTNFNDVTVSAAPADTDFWGTTASTIQSGVTVANGKITGTLKKLTSGALVNDWGEGHFLGLSFSGMTETAGTSVKVGLVPTQGAGFQTLDADKLGVWKISNKNTQRLEVITTDGKSNHVQTFDLSGLTLED